MTTPLDIIKFAQLASGVIGTGQTPSAEDSNTALFLLNNILSEFQINRWAVESLTSTSYTSSGAASYTVGPSALFNIAGVRPDKIDAAFTRFSGLDTYCYPLMSRESYDRICVNKAQTGIPTYFWYDPTISTLGVIYFWPIPVTTTYTLLINSKTYLGQFATLQDTITLPKPYISCLMYELAAQLRPFYGFGEDPQITQKAELTKIALLNSIQVMPTATQPTPSNRGGSSSSFVPGQQK
jgi:hypothetical protein